MPNETFETEVGELTYAQVQWVHERGGRSFNDLRKDEKGIYIPTYNPKKPGYEERYYVPEI
jgi:hypothetical protein